MLNTNYTPEIIMAQKFIEKNKDDTHFMNFLNSIKDKKISHLERWNLIFDYFYFRDFERNKKIITGIAFLQEG